MPIEPDGTITSKTPTDQLMIALEELSKRDDVKFCVVVFGCEKKNSEGFTENYTVMFSNADNWQTIGIVKQAQDQYL